MNINVRRRWHAVNQVPTYTAHARTAETYDDDATRRDTTPALLRRAFCLLLMRLRAREHET